MILSQLFISSQGFKFELQDTETLPSVEGVLIQSYDHNNFYGEYNQETEKYKHFQYNPNVKNVKPLCSAINVSGISTHLVPHTEHKIHSNCLGCPFFQFGSSLDPSRPNKKACQTTKRITILRGNLLLTFKFPVTSVKDFKKFLVRMEYMSYQTPIYKKILSWNIIPDSINQFKIVGKSTDKINETISNWDEYKKIQLESDQMIFSYFGQNNNQLEHNTDNTNNIRIPEIEETYEKLNDDLLDEDFMF